MNIFEQQGVKTRKVYYAEDIVLRYIETLNSLNSLLYELQRMGEGLGRALLTFKSNFLTLIIATEHFLAKNSRDFYLEVIKETEATKLIELFREFSKILVDNKIIDLRQYDVKPGFDYAD